MTKALTLAISFALALGVATALAGQTKPLSRAKTVSVLIDYAVGADGNCYITDRASWDGYQVNRVRHIFYRRTPPGGAYEWFTTTGWPQGETHPSGSFTSQSGAPAYQGESWYVHALFRSNGGAILAEADSPDLILPPSCAAQP